MRRDIRSRSEDDFPAAPARWRAPAGSRRDPACGEQHVGQTEERVELGRVFRQSAIPRLPVPKEILHDVEGMFDERAHISYVQQSWEEMEVLFHFLADRYEKKSVVITSILVFSHWDQIFKDPVTTMTAVDRLVHHATILEFTGDSAGEK